MKKVILAIGFIWLVGLSIVETKVFAGEVCQTSCFADSCMTYCN
jgi:hypothetical protein